MDVDGCPSILELLEARESGADGAIAEHLGSCARCGALAAELTEPLPELELHALRVARAARPEAPEEEGQMRTGELWEAPLGEHLQRVVAIIGRSPAPDTVLVAPVASALGMAAEGDVLVEASPLGYAHLVCV